MTRQPSPDPTISPTALLAQMGVSIWLDDLSRTLILSGELSRLVHTRHVSGVTSNPTIFARAIGAREAYASKLARLAARRTPIDEAVLELTSDDVTVAADILYGTFMRTGGQDGRVSVEVNPEYAHEPHLTVEQARRLWARINRQNLMIKIPGTREGLQAISDATAEGISVNVTLIFNRDRYREIIHAYCRGLERAERAGRDLSTIYSVASFFVSRVDSEVDYRLERIGTPEALALRGKAGVANARLAYQIFQEEMTTTRLARLRAHGANLQRPLWASTGVKDPALPDTYYVTELIAPETVTTVPPATLAAVEDHAVIASDTITGSYSASAAILDSLQRVGVSLDDVTYVLEHRGIRKFRDSWHELREAVRDRMYPVPA